MAGMPALPWRSFATADPGREYRFLITHLPLTSHRAIPRFMRLTRVVQRQLADSEGLIGYSLLARPLSRRFWTLSAWEDEAALMRFVAKNPHRDVMRSLDGEMGPTKFVRWDAPGSTVPPRWRDALARLEESAES